MIRALFHQWGDRFHRRMDFEAPATHHAKPSRLMRWWTANIVTDDPNPLPSNLDLIGGTYGIVHDTLARSTTVFGGTRLLNDTQLDRVTRDVKAAITTRAVVDALAADLEADPSLADVYAVQFGEHGDVEAIRGGLARRDGRGWA